MFQFKLYYSEVAARTSLLKFNSCSKSVIVETYSFAAATRVDCFLFHLLSYSYRNFKTGYNIFSIALTLSLIDRECTRKAICRSVSMSLDFYKDQELLSSRP